MFSHCLLVQRLFTSPPLCPVLVRACAGEGSCPQREQETSSDSIPVLIDSGAVDSSKWPEGQQVEAQTICLMYYSQDTVTVLANMIKSYF